LLNNFIRRNESNINVIHRKGNLTTDKIQKLEDANKILEEKVKKLMETHRQTNGVWYSQQTNFQNQALKKQMKRNSTMSENKIDDMEDLSDEESGMLYLIHF
jgi:hypothetical protein